MNWNLIPWAVAPALVAPLLLTDDPRTNGGLERVGGASASAASPADFQAWKDRLVARDLDLRERAFDDCAAEMRRNPDLRRAVRDWREGQDTELAWTARLLLREAREEGRGPAPFGGRGLLRDDFRARLDDLHEQFGDLDRMFEDLSRQFHQGFGGLTPLPRGQQTHREESIYSLQVTPNGVKVEVEEDVDGKVEKKTYEAKTLEELYEAHPELKDKIGAKVEIHGGPGAWWSAPGTPFGGSQNLDDGSFWWGQRAPKPLAGEMRTDVLGVMVEENFGDDARAKLSIEAGVGLKVASVQPGTIAAKIGVVEGDVIVDVNGRTIRATSDVREVLGARKRDQDVVVSLVDADGKRRTLTWRASAGGNADDARKF